MEETRKLLQEVEWKIKWEQDRLDKLVKDFNERSAKYGAFEIVTFIPNKVKDIAESKARVENLHEQKMMLEYLLRQMEA